MSDTASSTKKGILANSAVMAAGTAFSRMSGFIRAALLVAALGSATVAADVFNVANTIPTMLYILLAGGVFNAVLVPQLVRAIKNDPDGGEAYTNRIMTLGLLFLGTVTVLLVVAAPWLMDHVFLAKEFGEPELQAARDSAVLFAQLCLPQVFFYGMFTLVGQVLNSRGTFGPMMWAPIANNAISIVVLVVYLVLYGPVTGVRTGGDLPVNEIVLLGLGSTIGIVAQFLVLLPYMRRAGVVFRPRFDFRGAGLGHTLKLGVWTLLFVIVNQLAYVVVTKLGTSGTAEGGTGLNVYTNSMLMAMLTHGIVTVSLVTAMLPRLSAFAADRRTRDLSSALTSTLRTALVVLVPFAAILPVVAGDVANVAFGFGAGKGSAGDYVASLGIFGIGIIFFTVHYFMLRGFYALEDTRTVFFIQIVVTVVNIALAVLLVAKTSAHYTAASLVIAYSCAYAVGALVSWTVLRTRVGGLQESVMLRFAVRALVAVVLTTALSYLLWRLLGGDGEYTSQMGSLLRGGIVGVFQLVVFVAMAGAFRIREVRELVDPALASVRRRLPGS